MHLIEGKTADEVWRQAAGRIERREGALEQPSRNGATLELLHACLVVEQPSNRWILNRHPAMNPAFALAEVVWILSGRDDSDFLNFWNPKLPEFAGRGPAYYGAYGHRLRQRFKVDQLGHAYEALKANSESRQVVLQIWDATTDLPSTDGLPRGADIPCNVCAMLKVRDGRLEWAQIMRSNDLVLGWPHNVVQFTTLQEMMAAWLGLRPGPYVHFSDSLHVYTQNLVGLVEPNPVMLEANTDQWQTGFVETMADITDLARRMDAIIENPDAATIERQSTHQYSTSAPTNALALIGADAARRKKELHLADKLAARCTNPILRQMWARWLERKRLDSKQV